jgi:hypothetical protein
MEVFVTPRVLTRPLLALVVLAALAPACAVDAIDQGAEPASAPEGDDPASFCDDQNPCTADANCTPCSALPRAQRDIYHCTPDRELPPFCAGKTGCVHVDLTTPAGQRNDCFPVAGDADLHAGVCRAGVCAENPAMTE